MSYYVMHTAIIVAAGAQGVPEMDKIWELIALCVMYGKQAWVANSDSWGQNGLPMKERFFTAAEDRHKNCADK